MSRLICLSLLSLTIVIAGCVSAKKYKAAQASIAQAQASTAAQKATYDKAMSASEQQRKVYLDSANRLYTEKTAAEGRLQATREALAASSETSARLEEAALEATSARAKDSLRFANNDADRQRLSAQIRQLRGDARNIRADTISLSQKILDNIAFYCPTEMTEGETKTVVASLGQMTNDPAIRNIVRSQINLERMQNKQDTITDSQLQDNPVQLLDSVEVLLLDPSGRMLGADSATQIAVWRKVDTAIQTWTWHITPKNGEGGKGKITLYLTVRTKGTDNNLVDYPYPIDVRLPQTIWQAFLEKLRDTGWLFATVGSIIGFLTGLWKKKSAA